MHHQVIHNQRVLQLQPMQHLKHSHLPQIVLNQRPRNCIVEQLLLNGKSRRLSIAVVYESSDGLLMGEPAEIFLEVELVGVVFFGGESFLLFVKFIYNFFDYFSRLVYSAHIREDEVDFVGQDVVVACQPHRFMLKPLCPVILGTAPARQLT